LILIVGSNQAPTATYSERHNLGKSVLFTGTEFASVCHSSFADCPNLETHFGKFDHIYWADSSINEFTDYREYFESLFILKQYQARHHNVSMDVDPYNLRHHYTINNTPDSAVFYGCSHTFGVGLDNPADNYVNLVSQHYNKQILNLAEGGKSNYRSFEVFNKTNFYPDQIVVFQLTDVSRLKYYEFDTFASCVKETQLQNIRNRSYFDVYNDKQLIYMMLNHIEAVIRRSQAEKLRFVFFNMGGNNDLDHNPENTKFKKNVEYYLTDYAEYIPHVLGTNIDRGNDGHHFGASSHRNWSRAVIDHIEKLY